MVDRVILSFREMVEHVVGLFRRINLPMLTTPEERVSVCTLFAS